MLEFFAVFAAFGALGIAAMAPSVTFGDSGEFAASAAVWGLPHAPGYPLYVALAKALGTAAPMGNWAYRTNLFSVLAGAGALAVLADALRHAGIGRAARLGAIAALGFAPLWRYTSGVTEVFALHGLALSALIWVVVRFSGRFWEDRPMAAFGLVCGLGLANHQTIALAVPAALLEGLLSSPASSRRLVRGLSVAALFFVIGGAIYLCLPLRAVHGPPLDWGHPVDWPRFLHVFLRKDYGSLSLTVEGQAASGRLAAGGAQLLRFLEMSRGALGAIALAAALAGLGVWRASGARASVWFPVSWIILTGPFFLCLGNPPFDAQTAGALERFVLAPCLGVVLLAAACLQRLSAAGRAGRAAALCLAAAAALSGALSWPRWIERGDFAAYDYGRSVMRSLPPASSLFMDGGDDTFYTLAFLDFGQGVRRDLDLHDRGGLVFANPYGWDFRKLDFDAKETRRRGVESMLAAQDRLYYSTFKDSIVEGYTLAPWGLLKKAVRGAPGEQALWNLYPYRWNDETLAWHYRDRALVALYPILRGAESAARGRGEEGLSWIHEARLMAPDALWLAPNASFILGILGYKSSQAGRWDLAERALILAQKLRPEDLDSAVNLGVVYEKTGRAADAETIYRHAATVAPDASRPYFNLGALYWSQKRWADAAAAFDAALARSPGDRALANWASRARSKMR